MVHVFKESKASGYNKFMSVKHLKNGKSELNLHNKSYISQLFLFNYLYSFLFSSPKLTSVFKDQSLTPNYHCLVWVLVWWEARWHSLAATAPSTFPLSFLNPHPPRIFSCIGLLPWWQTLSTLPGFFFKFFFCLSWQRLLDWRLSLTTGAGTRIFFLNYPVTVQQLLYRVLLRLEWNPDFTAPWKESIRAESTL